MMTTTSTATPAGGGGDGVNGGGYYGYPPIKMEYMEGRGRFLKASKDIECGELVLEEKPYASIIDSTMETFVCAWCWKLNDLPESSNSKTETTPTTTAAMGTTNSDSNQPDLAVPLDEDVVMKDDANLLDDLGWVRWQTLPYVCESCAMAYYCSETCKQQHFTHWHGKGECTLLSRFKQRKDIKEKDGNIWFAPSDLTYMKLAVNIIIKVEMEIDNELRRGTNHTEEEIIESLFKAQPTGIFDFANTENNESTFAELWSLVGNSESFNEYRINSIMKMADAIIQFALLPTTKSREAWKVPTSIWLKQVNELARIGKRRRKPAAPKSCNRLVELICKLECNSFGIWLSNDEGIGLAIYPRSSFFNHSCGPSIGKLTSFVLSNVPENSESIKTIVNKVRAVRSDDQPIGSFEMKREHLQWFFALKDLKKDEELSYSYVDISKDGRARRDELEQHYYFKCMCSRCEVERLAQEVNDDNSKQKFQQVEDFVDWIVCKKKGCCGIIVSFVNHETNKLCRICKFCGEEQLLSRI